MEFKHYSVLLEETIEQLQVRPDGIYVDGTLGGGGHANEVCRRLTTGHFYGIDQDDAAIEAAGKRLEGYGEKVTIIRDNYCNMKAALAGYHVEKVDGIVLDLGFLPISWIQRKEGFPIGLMRRWICGWTSAAA